MSSPLVYHVVALLLICGLFTGCDSSPPTTSTADNDPHRYQLSDKRASREALALYNNLAAMRGKQMLFGHQDSLAYGVNWEARVTVRMCAM